MLLRGIFEATEVKTPTTFIIRGEVLPPELSAEEQEQLHVLMLKEDGDLSAEEQEQLHVLMLKEDGIERKKLTGDLKAANDRFDKGMTWLERLQNFGVIDIKEVFSDLMTKEKMYFYLVDELTGLPVRGDGYPIVITTPSEIVHKLLPVMQVGMHAMSLYNGVAGVSWMFGYPALRVPKAWCKDVQSSVEMLKQARI